MSVKKQPAKKAGSRSFQEQEVLVLGRSLRRMSRTCMDLMRRLGIEEEEVRFTRKKKPPRAAKKAEAEQAVAAE